ncbi:MAG: SLBB domain-containing protein, partial [Candidatus Delongbacteria bacterium]
MKKILLPIFLIFAALVYCQDEDLMKMYERITGKDLSKELEKFKSETDGELKSRKETEIDTTAYSGELIEQEEKKDSIPDLSYFEKYVGGKIIDPYESELKQYRIDFSSVRTNLNYNRHIPDNYMLNPGDLFIIDIWGAIEKSYNIELTNENFIIIPQIGKVDLSGASYGSAKEIIANRLSKISGIDYSIRLGEVRPITVFVVGNVSNPGVYNVSPFSSIIEVLAIAGGVNKQGSLRNIDLISEKSGSRKVDLYSLLFFGRNTVSILESNMTIFVPLIGKQVAVAGNVKREGIYEALEKEKLEDIIKIAGITPFSDTSRIEIERLDKEGRTKIMSLSLKNDPDIQAGDIIRIFSTLVYNRDFVYLKGNFRHNKMVQFNKGMKLGDVLSGPELLKDNTDMSYASIIRKNGLGKRDAVINFSPLNVIEKKRDHNISLVSRDTIEVFSLDSVNHFASVEISGEIKRPGVYKHTKEMTVSNLISYSGGITANGDISNVIIIRNSGKEGYEYFSDVDTKSFELESDDKVHVFDYAANNPVQKVQVWGNIKKNGSYIHSKNMTVTDLIIHIRQHIGVGFARHHIIVRPAIALRLSGGSRALQLGSQLPVSLTSFTAACVNGAVNVSWVTESETENSAFRIYRDG